MSKSRIMATLFSALLLSASACSGEPAVSIRGERFSIEIAADDRTRALGLMYRKAMEENHGMLFLFTDQRPRSFWMKNTRIPLDILYFDEQFKLVSMQLDVPPCRQTRCPSYPSGLPARYVLELNAGTAADLGVERGDVLQIHGELPTPR